MSATINNFTKRYPFAGPISWMVSIQYFVIQVVVAQAWTVNYSLAQNTISDLGNTTCAIYAGRFVCSAKHGLMNASFVILGVTMVVGSNPSSSLLRMARPRSKCCSGLGSQPLQVRSVAASG